MSSVFDSDGENSSTEEENIIQIDVGCPSRLNSYIIGVRGSRISPIREEFPEVRIDIGDTPDYIQVKGPESKAKLVKHKIETMIKEAQDMYKSYEIDISHEMKYYLLEKSGYHITRLRHETGVAINISETVEKCSIKMEGNEDKLKRAREIITTTLEQLNHLGDYAEEVVTIEKRYHGALMGHQAVTLKEIMNMFKGVHLRFPEKGENSDTIKIQGPKKMVNNCITHMLQMVEIRKKQMHITKTQDINKSVQLEHINTLDDDQTVHEVEIPAPKWINRFLIGINGSNINKISEEFPSVRIHFKDEVDGSTGGIILQGPTEDVDAASKKINIEITALLKRNEKETLTMNIKFMKHIIGKQGCNINRLREDSGAIINLEDIGEMCCVTLQGSKEAVNHAREAIEDLKNSSKIIECNDNIVERDLKINKSCYDYILETQGHNLNALRMKFNKVKIDLKDKGNNTYIIILSGLRDDINQCDNHFQNIIKECESPKLQSSTSTASLHSEISRSSSLQNLNAGSCLEHSDNLLNLRCQTHKAWICSDCCDEDHPRNYCKIITFEEELATRKTKEEQRLYEITNKVSNTLATLAKLGNEKEQERNTNLQTLKEMQTAIEKIKMDIGQVENEMSFINQVLSEGKQLQHKLDENKAKVSNATAISELSSITKMNTAYLTESKNWHEICKKDN